MSAADWVSFAALARRVMRHPRVAREELLAYQDEHLRAMVRHAGRNVPFYRDLYRRGGVDVEGFGGVVDLESLPRVEKRDLRLGRSEILAEGCDPERISMGLTSGSSGEPFGIWRTLSEARRVNLFRVRAHRQIGIRPRDVVCVVSEARPGGSPSWRGRVLRRLGFRKGSMIDAYQPVAGIAAELEAADPDAIVGYPSTLLRVASFLDGHGRRALRPRVVYTGGETLDEATRQRIQQGFGARVFDVYGSFEVDLVAWECPELGGMHLCEDNFVAEILEEGRPVAEGEVGELVVTALHNTAMPLLRYGLGDRVERGPSPCPCGQPFATLTRITGRTVDYIDLPGREPVHPLMVITPVIEAENAWVEVHQLVQEAPDQIVFRVQPLVPPPAGAVERMERVGREALGPDVGFRVEISKLSLESRGKFHPFVSRLEAPADRGATARRSADRSEPVEGPPRPTR